MFDAATKYPTGSRNPLSRRVIDIDSVSAFAKIEVAILCYIDAVLPQRDSVHRRFRLDQLISSPTSDFVRLQANLSRLYQADLPSIEPKAYSCCVRLDSRAG